MSILVKCSKCDHEFYLNTKDNPKQSSLCYSCWSKETPYDKLEITFIKDLIKEIKNE